ITEIYPAREASIEGVTARLVVDAAVAAGAAAHFADTLDALVDGLNATLAEGDVLIAMGAGDIDGAARRVLDRLRQGDPR
ncbi:MAG: UDP-N-acetylmuramate--L-alanine ligase, partial [Longimicrobiales bacterium]